MNKCRAGHLRLGGVAAPAARLTNPAAVALVKHHLLLAGPIIVMRDKESKRNSTRRQAWSMASRWREAT